MKAVVQCSKCPWKGEKTWGIHHYAMTHCSLEDAPFVCTACNFKTGIKSRLDKHLATPQHFKSVNDRPNGPFVIVRGTDAISKNLTLLGREESSSFWESKNVQKDDDDGLLKMMRAKIHNGDLDILRAAMD